MKLEKFNRSCLRIRKYQRLKRYTVLSAIVFARCLRQFIVAQRRTNQLIIAASMDFDYWEDQPDMEDDEAIGTQDYLPRDDYSSTMRFMKLGR